MLRLIRKIITGVSVAILTVSWCYAQPPAGDTKYHYRVLVGLKNNKALHDALEAIQGESWDNLFLEGDRGKKVCSAFNTYGQSFQKRAYGVDDTDEVLLLAARWKDGQSIESDCTLMPLRDTGIQQGDDITFYSRGFEGGEEIPVEIRNQGLAVDAKAAIDGRFTFLRLPFSRLMLYRDAGGDLIRAQNYQVIRLAIKRAPQKDEVTQVAQPFELYWEFRISRPRAWTGIELPNMWSYTPKDSASRALPVALATGIRFGTKHEFPRYYDWLIFGAPGFKVSGDSTSAVTSFAFGTMLDLADFIGFGVGLDKTSGNAARLSFFVSIGSNLRAAFPK